MDISIRRIFQLCAALIVVATIYRAGNGGLEAQPASDTALWDTLHTLIAPLARIYLSMFNSPATAILLSGGLVVVGILLILWFVFLKVRPAMRQLDRLIQDCARAPVQIGRIDGLDRVMGSSLLGTDWRAWRAAGPGGGRPSAYLSLASLERSGLRLGLIQSVPNYFVGLGLVMTFLGLIAGLWFASQGMRTADMAEARAALVQLLNSATFKFLTSVAGVGMSLVISVAFRISVQSLRGRLDLLCDRIEDAAARASYSPVAAAAASASDGSEALAEMISRLATSIDRLESAIVRQSAQVG
jgi:small-conductance mechanosensitive channel